jgi:hypothetical protein
VVFSRVEVCYERMVVNGAGGLAPMRPEVVIPTCCVKMAASEWLLELDMEFYLLSC